MELYNSKELSGQSIFGKVVEQSLFATKAEELWESMIPKERDVVRIMSGYGEGRIVEVIKSLPNKDIIGDDYEYYAVGNLEILINESERVDIA